MMNKYVSLLAGFAAVQGVMAELAADDPARKAEGFGNACLQNDMPESGPDYPCNAVVRRQMFCETTTSSLTEQKDCICAEGWKEWFFENHKGCVDCKVYHGVDVEEAGPYWKKVLEKTEKGYCKPGDAAKSFDQFFQQFRMAEVEKAMVGPDKAPVVHAEVDKDGNRDISVGKYFNPTHPKPSAASKPAGDDKPTPVYRKKLGGYHDVTIVAVATVCASPGEEAVHSAAGPVATTLAPKPSGAPFPTNSSISTVSGDKSCVYADLRAVVIQSGCVAEFKDLDDNTAPTYACWSKHVRNDNIDKQPFLSFKAEIAATFPDARFCGCIENELATGVEIKIKAGFGGADITAKTGFTPIVPNGETLVVDKKHDETKPRIGASAEPNFSGRSSFPTLNKEVVCAAAAPASKAAPANVNFKALITVTTVEKEGHKVYTPAVNGEPVKVVANPSKAAKASPSSPGAGNKAGPSGPDADEDDEPAGSSSSRVSPSGPGANEDDEPADSSSKVSPSSSGETGPEGPDGQPAPKSSASDSAAPKGAAADKAANGPGRAAPTGSVTPKESSLPLSSGATAMGVPALAAAAALLVAAL
ncbi:hypothetical protein CDD83_3495 [Cordyceps sp. RAO-2017]|nr:hypothetical protein CDD83_3495 [Cordyceps sp. RAO-2017]